MDRTRPDPRSSVDKALDLLWAVGADASVGVGVSELARQTGLSKSTAFRLLNALERNDAVERAGTNFRLGALFGDPGEPSSFLESELLREVFTPFLSHVYEQTRQTVHLAMLVGTEVVYLNKLHGPRPVPSPSRIGGRCPAYCTGVGKALLAFDRAAAERVMAGEMPPWTPQTLTCPETLAVELATIRRRRIAYDTEELRAGLCCVAVPIIGPTGQAAAALSVSGRAGSFRPAAHVCTLQQTCLRAATAYAAVAGLAG